MMPIQQTDIDISRPSFSDRPPWWGGDLQTLRNQVLARHQPLPGMPTQLAFPTSDGTGDILTGTLNIPPAPKPAQGPTLLLLHGLTGCEDSAYVRATAQYQLSRGRRVVRVNLRGAGSSRTTAGGYYFGGCTQDIQDMINGLDTELTRHGLFAIGYSLGGNILLNTLAALRASHSLIGAATVSAPIQPMEACIRLMAPRNAIYHWFLLRRMKREALSPHARLSGQEQNAIRAAKTLLAFDDQFTAPRHGYKDAADYYAKTAGYQFADKLTVPTLLVHAKNDPWIPAAPYLELQKRHLSNAKIIVTSGGGHVGFHDRASSIPWHDRIIDQFISTCAA